MKKLVLIFLILVLTAGGFFLFNQPKKPSKSILQDGAKTVVSQKASPKESYMFVPYWTIDSNIESIPYDKLIYFGISANQNGVVTDDEGFKNIEEFSKNAGSKRKLLTIRMLNTDTNLNILKSTPSQKKIVQEAIALAKEHSFEGIVLDLEIQGLPFEKLINSITSLHALFAKEIHASKLSFGTLLYGDSFYRIRPYDVAALSKNTDRVYVMAYDFSKAKSDPGPNFPLNGADVYGYDFKTMVSDFLEIIPRDKLTVTFGMFGYDWSVDTDGHGKNVAVPKTTLQFEKKLTMCLDNNSCTSSIDKNAMETKFEYNDLDEKHVVWFENSASVEGKIIYLHSQMVNSVGYWAYTYF